MENMQKAEGKGLGNCINKLVKIMVKRFAVYFIQFVEGSGSGGGLESMQHLLAQF